MAFTLDDPSGGGRAYVLLQIGWLLTLDRELTLLDRIRGHKVDEIDDALVSAVDDALAGLGAGPRRWCTSEEFERIDRAGLIGDGDLPWSVTH